MVAVSYARIFFRNAVNGGYLIPCESVEDLSRVIATGDEVELDIEKNELRLVGGDQSKIQNLKSKIFPLRPLGDILPILEAGDLFAYARVAGVG